MPFKENLRKKITLDRMAAAVEQAVPAVRREYQGIDKGLVRQFLELTSYRPLRLRDLEMYAHGGDGRAAEVLVLDNELPLYRDVDPEEVAMRRSPEVREMVSLKNIRKIMSDRDILIARGRQAIAYIHDEAVAEIDLSYTASDIKEIVHSGSVALEAGLGREVEASLELLFELLGYQEIERLEEQRLFGRPEPEGFRDPVLLREEGPPALKLAEGVYAPEVDESMEALSEVASGVRVPDAEGSDVLEYLGREVMRLKVA